MPKTLAEYWIENSKNPFRIKIYGNEYNIIGIDEFNAYTDECTVVDKNSVEWQLVKEKVYEWQWFYKTACGCFETTGFATDEAKLNFDDNDEVIHRIEESKREVKR